MQFSQDIFGLVPAGLHGTMAAHNVPFISDVPAYDMGIGMPIPRQRVNRRGAMVWGCPPGFVLGKARPADILPSCTAPSCKYTCSRAVSGVGGCVGGHCGQVGQLGVVDQDAGPLLAALVGAVGGYFFGRSRGRSPGKAAVPAAIGAAVGYFIFGKAVN